jgi:hypothetical protein
MTRQQRAALLALLEGPINTTTSVKRAGISAWSQRAGELERLGLVTRYRVRISETSAPVVEANLTDKGREIALGLRTMGALREGLARDPLVPGNSFAEGGAGTAREPDIALRSESAAPGRLQARQPSPSSASARAVPEPTGAKEPQADPPPAAAPAPSLFPEPARHDGRIG